MGFRRYTFDPPPQRPPAASTELRLRTLMADIEAVASEALRERPSLDMAEVERLAQSARRVR